MSYIKRSIKTKFINLFKKLVWITQHTENTVEIKLYWEYNNITNKIKCEQDPICLHSRTSIFITDSLIHVIVRNQIGITKYEIKDLEKIYELYIINKKLYCMKIIGYNELRVNTISLNYLLNKADKFTNKYSSLLLREI